MNASQIIEAKGGPKAVAEAVCVSPGAVRLWKHRNKIPRTIWPDLLRAYPDMSVEALVQSEVAA